MKRFLIALIALVIGQPCHAQKISALPDASTLIGNERIASAQGTGCKTQVQPCVNVGITPAQIGAYLGTVYQPLDTDLTAIAALMTQDYGRKLLPLANASAAQTYLGVSATGTDPYFAKLTGATFTGGLNGTTLSLSGGLAASNFTGSSSGINTGDNANTTGNAGTATKLATPRTINGVAFDGSAAITVPAVDTATPRLAVANNLSDVPSPQAAAAALGLPWVVARSTSPASVTGTTTETALATITIPAGAIGANGFVEVIALFSNTSSANTKNFLLRLNGSQLAGQSATTNPSQRYLWDFNNAGSQASQVGIAGSGTGGTGTTIFRTSVNTAVSTTLTITGTLASTADTITLESYIIRVTYGA